MSNQVGIIHGRLHSGLLKRLALGNLSEEDREFFIDLYTITLKDIDDPLGFVIAKPKPEEPEWLTCQECEHSGKDDSRKEGEACFKDYDNLDAPKPKFGDECPNFKRKKELS